MLDCSPLLCSGFMVLGRKGENFNMGIMTIANLALKEARIVLMSFLMQETKYWLQSRFRG